MHKTKASSEEKIKAVEAYLSGEGSQKGWAKKFGIEKSAFSQWIHNYKSMGSNGLRPQKNNRKYTLEMKREAVLAYLSGKGSLREICERYKIRSDWQLRVWVKEYNGHKEIRASSGKGSEFYMTKGRKTTREERVEIVSYCIEHNKNYAETIEKHDISYQQIYAWVRKYEERGVDGLSDKRGKRKAVAEMTEIEKLRAEYRLLTAKNKRLELENAVLKKLKELRRR